MSKQEAAMPVKRQSALVLWVKMHIYIMLAGITVILLAGVYWYFYIARVSYDAGALHIKQIIPMNELKTMQSELDVLVNVESKAGKYFSALTTTKFAAGVKMDDLTITEDAKVIHIHIPAPHVVSSETYKQKLIRDDSPGQSTIDAVKEFAKRFAQYSLEKEGLLIDAQKGAKLLIEPFAKNIALKKKKGIDISMEPISKEKSARIAMHTDRTGLYVNYFPLKNKWNPVETFSSVDVHYPLFRWTSSDATITIYPLGSLQGSSSITAPTKCNDPNWADQFNPLNPELPFKMLTMPASFFAQFCWQAGGQIYGMDFKASDDHTYKKKLPDAMMLAYGVRYDDDFHLNPGMRYALGGISHHDWIGSSLLSRWTYLSDSSALFRWAYSIGTSMPGLSRLRLSILGLTDIGSFNQTVKIFVGLSSDADTDFEKAKNLVKKAWEKIPPVEHNSVRFVLYDPKKLSPHRQRIIILTERNAYFFIPSRLVQDSVFKAIGIDLLNQAREGNGTRSIDGESFDNEIFNKVLDRIANKKLFDLIEVH